MILSNRPDKNSKLIESVLLPLGPEVEEVSLLSHVMLLSWTGVKYPSVREQGRTSLQQKRLIKTVPGSGAQRAVSPA